MISLFFGESKTEKSGTSYVKTIRVNGSTPGGLKEALRQAKRNTRILIEGDLTDFNVWIRADQSNVTIEGEANSLLKLSDAAPPNSKILAIESATNVTLKGITLDGGNKSAALIMMYGKCSGCKLDNLRMRNSAGCDLLFSNCEGDSDHPILLQHLEFQPTEGKPAVRFDILERQLISQNRFITFDKCRFVGTGKKVVAAQEHFVDLTTVRLPPDEKLSISP